jgi:DNA repair protein SbcD/Mre11
LKILHTSDVHLDRCFTGGGLPASFGNRRRASLRAAFEGIVRRAGEWSADVLLIAGDLVEHDRLTRETVDFLRGQFESIPDVQIFIAPGNEDPYTIESVYATEAWPSNVHIFNKSTWSSVPICGGAAIVHGFGFDSPYISQNPFGDLELPDDSGEVIHIAVAHGSEKNHLPVGKEACAPFLAAEAVVPGLHYMALGHYHESVEITGNFDTRVWYSGALEGMSFLETGEHHYLEVEIDDGNHSVDVRRVQASDVVYCNEDLTCDGYTTSQEVIEAIRAIGKGQEGRVIGRFTLRGLCVPAIQSEIGLIHDAVSLEFEHLELFDGTTPAEDYEELAREDTSLGEFVRTLNEQIEGTSVRARGEMLERARELGVAAFRDRSVEIRGLERG